MSAAADGKGEKAQFNVYLPVELVRRIKHQAIDDGESLSALVERAMEEFLERNGSHEHD
jgi:predicted HicB family RNase H-like nuclease